MKKPQWILIGITLMFTCVLLGLYFGRNSTRNYIPINNIIPPATENTSPNNQISQSKDGKIDINTATEAQLTLLPGVGEVTAKNIIEYRTQHGKFVVIEDIMKVSGIGEKKFEQMKPYIKVE